MSSVGIRSRTRFEIPGILSGVMPSKELMAQYKMVANVVKKMISDPTSVTICGILTPAPDRTRVYSEDIRDGMNSAISKKIAC